MKPSQLPAVQSSLVALAMVAGIVPSPFLRAATPPGTMRETATLDVAGVYTTDEFGRRLALEDDLLVVGAPYAGGGDGAIYSFLQTDRGWSLEGRVPPVPDSTFDQFGSSLALQGKTLAVGAPRDNARGTAAGAVHVFERNAGTWMPGPALLDPGAASNDKLGSDVGVSGDYLFAGAPGRNSSRGAVVVFRRNGARWDFHQTLSASDQPAAAEFGARLVGDPRRLLVGAPRAGDRGAVYAFALNTASGNWEERQRLAVAELNSNAGFGNALALRNDVALIAAWNRQLDTTFGAGGVYVFTETEGVWHPGPLLLPPEDLRGPFNFFGSDVALAEDLVAVTQQNPPAVLTFRPWGDRWTHFGTALAGEEEFTSATIGGVAAWDTTVAAGVLGTQSEEDFAEVRAWEVDVHEPAFVTRLASALLDYGAGDASGELARDRAAFRYRHFLYQAETNRVRPHHDQMGDWYGDAERDRAEVAERLLLAALRVHPEDPALGELLLDLYADRATAEQILLEDQLTQGAKTRLGPPLVNPPPEGRFVIDLEIPILESAAQQSQRLLTQYFRLFSLEREGVGEGKDAALGRNLFARLVPARKLRPATYVAEDGKTLPVVSDPVLLPGYRDLLLAYDLLGEHAHVNAQLSRLLLARDGTDDRTRAASWLGRTQRSLVVQAGILDGLFPGLDPEPGDGTGLAEAITAFTTELQRLVTLADHVGTGGNILGFGEDFLMYVQRFAAQGQPPGEQLFDSYDALRIRLNPDAQDNPLGFARFRLTEAVRTYEAFRGFEDQWEDQFRDSSVTYEDRLRDIVGVYPDNPNYSNVPTNNPGSELDQQFRSIEAAHLRVTRNRVEIDNVHRQVQIELQKTAAISNAVVNFGNQQARITETLGHIRAGQAALQGITDTFSPGNLLDLSKAANPGRLVKGAFGLGAINAVAQGAAEEYKGRLEASKERLAALEEATITGIESEATVKTLLLQLATLDVDSREAALLLQQEVSRLTALYREKEDLEKRLAQRDASVARRYFADPIHRLRSSADMESAHHAFDEAQRWMYFMVRALQYKWNSPFENFEHPFQSRRLWSANSIFKLRNADELLAFHRAMDDFEASIQLPRQHGVVDWFSVRDDFFGYIPTNRTGQMLTYPDPVSGQPVDAITAFRSRLRQLLNARNEIELSFSTTRRPPGSTFFSERTYLDKIETIQVNLPGAHTVGRPTLEGLLRYGGTSFLRRKRAGVPFPDRPDRLADEMTAYSTRFWYFDDDPPPGARPDWRFTEAFSAPVAMLKSADPRIPPGSTASTLFRERSVAATDWRLTIPTRDAGVAVLDLDELDDIELVFAHSYIPRP